LTVSAFLADETYQRLLFNRSTKRRADLAQMAGICAQRPSRQNFAMLKVQRSLYLQVACLGLAIALVIFFAWSFPILDIIAQAQLHVMHWGTWSAIGYPILFAACSLLLLPGGVLSIGSGFLFGLWWGFVIVLIGNILAAAVAFVLSRRFGRRWLAPRIAQSRTLNLLEPAVEREGWKIICLSQLHPLFPASLLNYFYGLTRIPFRIYIGWTTLGRAPGLFLYTYLGTLGQLGLNVARGKSHPRVVEYWTWGGAFVTTALLFVVLTRLALHAIQNSASSRAVVAPEEQGAHKNRSYINTTQ
jgi:uncharacterized membrane protein YdjX (TVP38/TMEM64 family)